MRHSALSYLLPRLLCLTLLLLPQGGLAEELISRIAAVVNDEIITTRQLQQRLDGLPSGMPRDPQAQLELMIDDLLLRARAKELGVQVSEEDIDRAVADVQQQNRIDAAQLEQALLAQGLTLARYREQLREQILRYKLTGIEVQSKVDVTRQEIRSYYQEHLDRYRHKPRLRLSRLSFPLGRDADAVRAAAEQARQDLAAGRSIEAVLADLPPHAAADGDDMGSFAPGELSAEFEAAVVDVPQGAVSAPVERDGILHLLRVEERLAGGVTDLSQVEEDIRNQLRQQKMEQRLKTWRDELRQSAYIDIRL